MTAPRPEAVELATAQRDAMRGALENVKKHLEVVLGPAASGSTVYAIVCRALGAL